MFKWFKKKKQPNYTIKCEYARIEDAEGFLGYVQGQVSYFINDEEVTAERFFERV